MNATQSADRMDVSLLRKPVTTREIDDYRRLTGEYFSFSALKTMTIAACCAMTASGLVMLIVPSQKIIAIATIATISAMWLGVQTLSVWLETKKYVQMKRFADAHGFTYEPTGGEVIAGDGIIFSAGLDGRFRGVLSRTIHGRRLFEVGTYDYSSNNESPRDSRTVWYYACVALDRKVPHIILDAKGNDFGTLGSNLPLGFHKRQETVLEGDFHRYFTVYAPEGYGRDVRYVLTPDIMALLVDESAMTDIELIDDHLYFYIGQHRLTHRDAMVRLLRLVDAVGQKLHRQTDYYADDRVVSARQDNVVHKSGTRLAVTATRLSVMATVVAALLAIAMMAS